MSFAFDIPVALMDSYRLAARDATISMARSFGLGGSTWYVDRPSGSGVTGRVLHRQASPVLALCWRQRPSQLAGTSGGVATGDEDWYTIVLSGDVQPDDVLVSAGSPPLAVRVDNLEEWYSYQRGNVSEVRSDH